MIGRLQQRLPDAQIIALGRTMVGLSLLARPRLLPALMGADHASSVQLTWIVQMLGAREVALGVGTLAARRESRPWVAAGAFSDAVDAVAVAAALRRGQVASVPGAGLVLVALLAVASQIRGFHR